MPAPRHLGNVAKSALVDLLREVEGNMGRITDIAHFTRLNQPEKAHEAEKHTLDTTMLVIRTLTRLINDDIAGAEEVVLDHKHNKKS